MSGPMVRLGTNTPSITSQWIRSHPAGLEGGDLIAETGEVGGQNRWTDFDRAHHDATTRVACRRFDRSGWFRGRWIPFAPWNSARRHRGRAGVARAEDGRVVFVEGALPGESVTAEVVRTDKRWSQPVW